MMVGLRLMGVQQLLWQQLLSVRVVLVRTSCSLFPSMSRSMEILLRRVYHTYLAVTGSKHFEPWDDRILSIRLSSRIPHPTMLIF